MGVASGSAFTIPAIEEEPLSMRQKLLIGAAVVSNTVEFFDFFIIGVANPLIKQALEDEVKALINARDTLQELK